MLKIIHIASLSFCIWISISIHAQSELLVNPSLDGIDFVDTGKYCRPYQWETCYDEGDMEDSWNDPNFDTCYKSTDLCKIDGDTYCMLLARRDGSDPRSGKYEHISSKLVQSLKSNVSYTLKIWLVSIYGYENSLRFQVFGADTFCIANESDKLIDTLVTNTSWIEYTFEFIPTKNYDYIYFRVYWDNKIMEQTGMKYNGRMLLDKSSLTPSCEYQIFTTDTLYYSEKPHLQLHAPDGFSCSWSPADYLSNTTVQSPYMTSFYDSVKVNLIDNNNCAAEKNFIILFSCDTLYPTEIHNIYDIYYKTYEANELNASTGDTYEWYWDDTVSLYSNYKSVNQIKNYQEQFYVTIKSYDSCEFREQFNILLDCEYLYDYPMDCPLEGSEELFRCKENVIETTSGSQVQLNAQLPELTGLNYDAIQSYNWEPEEYLDFLSSQDFKTEVTPIENLRFTLQYTDTFNCKFYEVFLLELALKIPNVITPGLHGEDDGKNDVFRIPGLPENSAIEIYNKSGCLIFKADPYSAINWWDGTDMDGKTVHSGTYWYVLRIGDTGKPIKGFVLVKR